MENIAQYPNTKFNMVLCELFHPRIHGQDSHSDPNINGHYLVHSRYHNYKMIQTETRTYLEEDEGEDVFNITKMIPCFKSYIRQRRAIATHDFIRNYKKIVSDKNYIKLEIAQCIYLSGGECVAILKTFWIRIIQRAWKRVYKERSTMIRGFYKNPASFIKERQTGFTPYKVPGLRGMLVKNQ